MDVANTDIVWRTVTADISLLRYFAFLAASFLFGKTSTEAAQDPCGGYFFKGDQYWPMDKYRFVYAHSYMRVAIFVFMLISLCVPCVYECC